MVRVYAPKNLRSGNDGEQYEVRIREKNKIQPKKYIYCNRKTAWEK